MRQSMAVNDFDDIFGDTQTLDQQLLIHKINVNRSRKRIKIVVGLLTTGILSFIIGFLSRGVYEEDCSDGSL